MAYDAGLAERIRRLVSDEAGLTEKKMFGGLSFFVVGNMAVTASSHGGVMIRVDPRQADDVAAETGATVVEMRGRPMPGWLYREAADLADDDELAAWVTLGTDYARSLPPKPQSAPGAIARGGTK
jgi:TfoX/Sxy family transcriptional regulator of competence genes